MLEEYWDRGDLEKVEDKWFFELENQFVMENPRYVWNVIGRERVLLFSFSVEASCEALCATPTAPRNCGATAPCHLCRAGRGRGDVGGDLPRSRRRGKRGRGRRVPPISVASRGYHEEGLEGPDEDEEEENEEEFVVCTEDLNHVALLPHLFSKEEPVALTGRSGGPSRWS